jgi:hypothetical protein
MPLAVTAVSMMTAAGLIGFSTDPRQASWVVVASSGLVDFGGPHTVTRLTVQWQADHAALQERDLSGWSALPAGQVPDDVADQMVSIGW